MMTIELKIEQIGEGNPQSAEEQNYLLKHVTSQILRGYKEGECFFEELGTGHTIKGYWKLGVKED